MNQSRPKRRSFARRVLVVAPQPFYEDRGTPIAVRELVTALAGLGFEVDLATFPVGATPHAAIAEAISRLLRDRTLADGLVMRARAYAETHLHPARFVVSLRELCEGLGAEVWEVVRV